MIFGNNILIKKRELFETTPVQDLIALATTEGATFEAETCLQTFYDNL